MEISRKVHQPILHPIRRLFDAVYHSQESLAYISFLLRPAMKNHPTLWLQQDGATVHTAKDSIALLMDI